LKNKPATTRHKILRLYFRNSLREEYNFQQKLPLSPPLPGFFGGLR